MAFILGCTAYPCLTLFINYDGLQTGPEAASGARSSQPMSGLIAIGNR